MLDIAPCPNAGCYLCSVYNMLHGVAMKMASAKLGWLSNIFLTEVQTCRYFYITLYSSPRIFFSALLTHVHFESNCRVYAIASILRVETGNTMIATDLRVCHIRRKTEISVTSKNEAQLTGYICVRLENIWETEKLFTQVYSYFEKTDTRTNKYKLPMTSFSQETRGFITRNEVDIWNSHPLLCEDKRL